MLAKSRFMSFIAFMQSFYVCVLIQPLQYCQSEPHAVRDIRGY